MARNEDLILLMRSPADREMNDRLYPLVVAGNKAAREEMITANMALVTNKVQAYLVRFPQNSHLRDDLISQGFAGLTEAVNNMVGREVQDPNPTGFISQHIQHALGELMDTEATIRIPIRTYIRHKDTMEPAAKEHSLTVQDVLDREGQQDPRAIVDLRDELEGCCECDLDRDIIRLREEGRSDETIATMLGIPKTTAYMMRRSLYARFLERNPEYQGEV